VVTSFVDLIDPQASGVEAFVVRDGWFAPLRRPGWHHKDDRSERFGKAYGRKAGPKDPMPVSSGRFNEPGLLGSLPQEVLGGVGLAGVGAGRQAEGTAASGSPATRPGADGEHARYSSCLVGHIAVCEAAQAWGGCAVSCGR
jgi:hypothetical protein